MPIDVTCPGCKARFQVSEQYAGKKGPCPKCKTVITIPKLDEQVVVHEAEQFGPKDSKGRAVLRPIQRTETKVTTPFIVAVVVAVIVVLIGAVVVRVQFPNKTAPYWLLSLGAALLAPALVWSGYTFLRDDELEPHRGRWLLLRVLACSALYATLWAVYLGVKQSPLLEGKPPQAFDLIYIVPPFVLAGGSVAFLSLDLGFGNGLLHYGFYLLITVLLRMVVGLEPM